MLSLAWNVNVPEPVVGAAVAIVGALAGVLVLAPLTASTVLG